MPRTRTPRTHRTVLTNPFALVYLVICAGLLVWALIVSSADTPDASMAGVVPLLATAPASLVLLVLPDHSAMFIVSVVVGALVNASVIGWCARTLSRYRNGPGSTA
ncbi:SCO4225 family membrane protein [Streptomyces aureocirculatus]|uniref:SCO4225 family membrane protein n=1 Tax=Streptomyces aureocirculatus TaxID=67275 RepID=UPI0004C6BDC6|nr:hypothetical protein [Streptomyces aureocirculatus]